jgi:AcrR family transcriptional regulator
MGESEANASLDLATREVTMSSVGQLIDEWRLEAYPVGQVIDGYELSEMNDDAGTESEGASGNRRALVRAAYARIASGGFEGLRTRDVAADVGINIGTLHYYFPSKEALIRAAVRHTFAKFGATLSSKGSPAEQLRGHLEGVRHLLKTDQALWSVSSEIALRAGRDEAIAELARQSDDQWYAFLRGLIARGIEQGALDGSLDSGGAAATIIAAVKGLSMPTMGSFQPERIDQTFDQLERWLRLRAATTAVRDER